MKLNKMIASAIIGGLTAGVLAIADDHGTTAPAVDHGTEVKKETPAKTVAKKTKKKKVAKTKDACDGKHGCKGEVKTEKTDAPAHTEEKAPAH